MVAASSQKQGKTGWLFGLCVVMAILVLIAGCEKKAPKRQSAPLTVPPSVSPAGNRCARDHRSRHTRHRAAHHLA